MYAMPSLMAAHWVGQNSGPILDVCGPKYIELSWLVESVCSLQCRFLTDDVLLHSRDIRNQVAKLSEISQNFDVCRPPNFRGKRHPNF